MSRVLIISLILFMVAGCSNNGRSYTDTSMAETLEMEIMPNASKMFTYRLRWPEASITSPRQVARNGNRPGREFARGGVDVGRGSYDRLLANTAYVVERSGYCRDGFFELDRSISRYHLWVRGECKDSASDEDRNIFSEKQILQASHWNKTGK